jgi:hypothetical protein
MGNLGCAKGKGRKDRLQGAVCVEPLKIFLSRLSQNCLNESNKLLGFHLCFPIALECETKILLTNSFKFVQIFFTNFHSPILRSKCQSRRLSYVPIWQTLTSSTGKGETILSPYMARKTIRYFKPLGSSEAQQAKQMKDC